MIQFPGSIWVEPRDQNSRPRMGESFCSGKMFGGRMADKKEQYEDSALYRIRHSAAHIMAQAVLEKFPDGKVAIGPAIEDGFYYDFDLPRPLTPEDLESIEKRMRGIIQSKVKFERKVISAEEAKEIFHDQPFKLELIAGLEEGNLDEHGNPSWKNRRFPSIHRVVLWTCVVDPT
jgi:threonyl-tRNA synthetase